MTLPIRDQMTIRLAAAHYRHPAAREADAYTQLGMRPVIFHRHVNALLDDPAALVALPREVNRLRRLRDARRRVRAA